jgi:radical SAM protein with 4Fe4S-binding SPASM domain
MQRRTAVGSDRRAGLGNGMLEIKPTEEPVELVAIPSTPRPKHGLGRAVREFSIVERVLWPAWCALASLVPFDASSSGTTHRLSVAGQCTNLSCVHNAADWQESEAAQAYDFPEEWIESSLETLEHRGLTEVFATNFGAKAVRQGWQALCQSNSLAPPELIIVNDLTLPMSAEDIVGLSRMESVQIDIETADPELFSKLHQGRLLETVLANIDKLRAYAHSENLRQPELVFEIEVTSKTVSGLEKLVQLGLDHGVRSFHFSNFYKGSKVRDELQVFNVTTLPWGELNEALGALERAVALAKSADCAAECDPKLRQAIRAEMRKFSNSRTLLRGCDVTAPQGPVPVRRGMTRNCTLPWTYINLCSHGEVRPCWEFRASVGNLQYESLGEILNGPKLRQLRRNLLSGKLDAHRCQRCTVMPQIPVRAFRRRIKGSLILWEMRRRFLNLLQWIDSL